MSIGVTASEPFSASKLQRLLSFLFAMSPKENKVIKVEKPDPNQEKRDQANMANPAGCCNQILEAVSIAQLKKRCCLLGVKEIVSSPWEV